MKLFKPTFVTHESNPIFSCDIHPDGLRFATGGQGKYSGRIAIWNLCAAIDEKVENDDNVPKLLCHLDNHLSCVNSVRWSGSGKFLASGGDDKLIMIWTRSGEARVNSNGVLVGLEQWRCQHTLNGHDSDVLDLAWDSTDSRIASCSVDNSIIVWNMDGRPSIVARLNGHAGLVKGVVWDPVGEYLASQSDDRSLRIWRTSDWGLQVTITEPFQECGDMTHVLRLNWSPDGLYVVSAHASNNGGPTAQIIERPMDAEKLSWPCDLDFVGHRKAVTCVSFNRNLLKKLPNESKFCVAATGSRDCKIAVWSTKQRRPLFVIDNIFSKAVLDMSWSSDGHILMACSWDGTVACFHFKEGELGSVVSEEEKMMALESLYGKRLLYGKVEPVIEAAELLSTDVATKVEPPAEAKTVLPPPVSPAPSSTAKQIETRRPDGKRRITPITVPRDAPIETNASQSFSSSSNLKTKIIVEKIDEGAKKPAEVSNSVVLAPSPAPVEPPCKVKRMLLVPSDPVTPRVNTTLEPRPRQEIRYVNSPVLRPLGMEARGSTPVAGAPTNFISIENMKDPPLAKVKREIKGPDASVVWEILLGHAVTAARSTKTTTVLACADRSVHILESASGAPRILPLLLPGLAACLDLTTREQLCVVTTCGHVVTWDLVKNIQTLCNETLRGELQTDNASFLSCKLKEDGWPIVVLTNGRSFSYSSSMGWQLLSDNKTAVWQLSSQKDLLSSLPPADGGLALRSLFREQRSALGSSGVRVGLVGSATAAQCSVALLYHQLLAAVTLGSEAEVQALLLGLVRVLAQDGALPQLRSLITTHAVPRGLLTESLAILKEFLHCQRLYMELNVPQDINGDESLGPPAMET